jgi:hypothetical protein
MNSRVPEQTHEPEDTMNAADYVDSLLRPKSERVVVASYKIKGRRLRDQYLEEVTVTRLIEPQV